MSDLMKILAVHQSLVLHNLAVDELFSAMFPRAPLVYNVYVYRMASTVTSP